MWIMLLELSYNLKVLFYSVVEKQVNKLKILCNMFFENILIYFNCVVFKKCNFGKEIEVYYF